jgi:hypothetical protein
MAETITITLDHIETLFDEPDLNPWDPSARYRSGIDEIIVKLRAIPIRESVSLIIRVPKETMTADLDSRTKQAIDRYCMAQIETNEDEKRAVKKEGRTDFLISVIGVLALFLIIAIIVHGLQLEGALLSAIVGWTGIASWAILWGPVDTFIWGRLPLRRAISYHQKLKASNVEIQPI